MNIITPSLYLLLCFFVFVATERSLATGENQVEIKQTVTNGFIHPGIGLTKEILDNARDQVRAKREPWYSSYQKLARNPNSAKTIEIINQSKSDPNRAATTTFNDRNTMKQLDYDAEKAYRQALMYYFTGDLAHRANAMMIIRLWSQLNPKSFGTFHSSHIHTPYPVMDLVMAAELMRYTESPDPKLAWTTEDTENLTKNLLIPSIDTYMYSNAWFMNQMGYPLAGAMACYIFMNDRENYEKRVEWFTVNKNAPNEGSSSAIKHLFRRVEVDAATRKRVKEPFVQLMEMGRDQAHSAGDMEIACRTARMMNAQGTKVDPVRGTVSTNRNAVGVYEFLDNRILAAADYFSRFMLGYDTPWIPSPSITDADGKAQQIYHRLADNYRGRIRDLEQWDLYYYYTYKKGIDLSKIAPYYVEAFAKRVEKNDFQWLYIPPNAKGEAVRVLTTPQEPDVINIVERSTHFGNAKVVKEGDDSFLRINPSGEGKRIALLSIKTPSKLIGLKIRTSGVAFLEMEGFRKPWLLPDTQGQWRYVAYQIEDFEHVEDIIFVHAKGSPGTTLDLAQFIRQPANRLTLATFADGNGPLCFNAYVGAPITLDLSAENSQGFTYQSQNLPEGAVLDAKSGIFTWSPQAVRNVSFALEVHGGNTVTARKISISVTKNRDTAMRAIRSVFDSDAHYTKASLDKCIELYREVQSVSKKLDDTEFWKELISLQEAFNNLEILTPLRPDGSVDYPVLVVESDLGSDIGLLADGNDDTFPDSVEDLDYVFDFGEKYRMSFTSFGIEGRMNFDERTTNTVFYGSNDEKDWLELTEPTEESAEMVNVKVSARRRKTQFRYLRVKGGGHKFFEPAELRIYGSRHDAEESTR